MSHPTSASRATGMLTPGRAGGSTDWPMTKTLWSECREPVGEERSSIGRRQTSISRSRTLTIQCSGTADAASTRTCPGRFTRHGRVATHTRSAATRSSNVSRRRITEYPSPSTSTSGSRGRLL
jgi:hypothetical protein